MFCQQTAIYCRAAGRGEIRRQKELLLAFAEAKGFATIAVYEDTGGMKTPDWPAFARLEADIRAGGIARVLVFDLSKIGRNLAESARWVRWLRKQDIGFYALETQVGICPCRIELE